MLRKAQLYLFTIIAIASFLTTLYLYLTTLNSEIETSLNNIIVHRIQEILEFHNTTKGLIKFTFEYYRAVKVPFIVMTYNPNQKNITGIILNFSKIFNGVYRNILVVDKDYNLIGYNYTIISPNLINITIEIPKFKKMENYYIFEGYIVVGNLTEKKKIINNAVKSYYYINYLGVSYIDTNIFNMLNSLNNEFKVTPYKNYTTYMSSYYTINLPNG